MFRRPPKPIYKSGINLPQISTKPQPGDFIFEAQRCQTTMKQEAAITFDLKQSNYRSQK